MARRSSHTAELTLFDLPSGNPPTGTAKRKADRNWSTAKRILVGLLFASLTTGTVIALGAVDDFLNSDGRFRLECTDRQFRITGNRHASRARIARVFEPDMGRSIKRIPLAERRRQLLAIDWIRDASVERVWPDQIVVHVQERVPVAFVLLPDQSRAGVSRYALVDAEGVILEPETPARYNLPVLAGVSRQDSESKRAVRVRQMETILREAGTSADQISEVDLSDPLNAKVTEQADGHSIVLMLGNENYGSRLRHFHTHAKAIRMANPNAGSFDLRMDGRVIVMNAAPEMGELTTWRR
jgi:cell division septal protein FtsQ